MKKKYSLGIIITFGVNLRVMTTKQVAKIHNMENGKINELINNNIDEFECGIDLLEIKAILTEDSQYLKYTIWKIKM